MDDPSNEDSGRRAPAPGAGAGAGLRESADREARKGPTDAQRARDEVYLYGEAWDEAGHKVAMRLRTREGYTLTAESSVRATLNVMECRLVPGAYTPSMAFGADYVLELEGSKLTRVAVTPVSP